MQAPAAPAAARTPRPLGGDPDDIELPPLDQSDALVRTLVQGLSSHPSVAAWLATDGLIRNFTVVVSNIAVGKTPVQHLKVLKPGDRFRTSARAGDLRIDAACVPGDTTTSPRPWGRSTRSPRRGSTPR